MKDLPPVDLLALVTENRDPDAARSLIAYFHAQMNTGEGYGRNRLDPADRELLEAYCFQAFTQIVDGKSADVAFGLKKPRGRPKQDTFERDLGIACHVESLRRSGNSFETAVELVAETFSISESAVKLAYKKSEFTVPQLSNVEINKILSFENRR